MTPMTVRGVPRSLARDAWWIAADSQTGVGSGQAVARRPWWLLLILVVICDVMLLRTQLGLGFVVTILSIAGGAHFVRRTEVARKMALTAWGVLLVALIPAVDVVQPISFLFGLCGLAIFAGLISGPRWGQAALRLPGYGIAQWVRDLRTSEMRGPSRSLVLDWLLPVAVGGVFIVLMIAANPLVDGWLSRLDWSHRPDLGRVIMWLVLAMMVWPMLRLAQMKLHWQKPAQTRKPVSIAYLNARSVLRALVVFNVIFAVQTLLDLGYLWGGVRLPDGMTYATYAHRGAYPLMMTALLAGGFALVAQPWLNGRMMRGLLLVWIAQTLVLVMSSILRIDLYVGSYGLTHLRFAAFVWMIVVALGLVVLILQIVGRKDAAWMLQRSFGIGFVAVYLCSLTNIDGYVADHQLTQGPLDVSYVCNLGEGAAPVIAVYEPDMCWNRYHEPTVHAPKDWRDWGFRNARLRRSLSAMQAEAKP